MTLPTNEQLEAMPIIPIKGQSFSSEQDWINRATRCLTSHPQYRNTEHGGPAGGWRGPHFTTMCFDQLGRRVRNGGEFARAKKDSAYPVWWIWPDQIATLAAQRIADAKRIAELEAAQVTTQEAARVLLAAIDARSFDVVVGACFGDEAASRVMHYSRPIVFARTMLTATINYLDPSLDYLRAGADAKVGTP